MKRIREECGAELVEAAVTIPLLLLIAVGIFDFGRAYQTWQVLTNASREAARYAVTPGAQVPQAQSIARTYMNAGGLPLADVAAATVSVDRSVPLPVGLGTQVTISYPFRFMFLQPVARLVNRSAGTAPGGPITMVTRSMMRNEM